MNAQDQRLCGDYRDLLIRYILALKIAPEYTEGERLAMNTLKMNILCEYDDEYPEDEYTEGEYDDEP